MESKRKVVVVHSGNESAFVILSFCYSKEKRMAAKQFASGP
jgi:hypothetical protein